MKIFVKNSKKGSRPFMVFYITTILFCVLFSCSTTNEIIEESDMKHSIQELILKLPNLKVFNISECEFILTKVKRSKGFIPSPTDISLKIIGSAKFDTVSWGKIRSNFEWAPVSQEAVPKNLIRKLPSGVILSSYQMNESFKDNPTFAHGFLVISEKIEKCFFVVTDLDHPLRF